MGDQDSIILTDRDSIIKIEPFSRLWRKIRRDKRKQRYIPGRGVGAPVATDKVVKFRDGTIMVKYSDGSLRKGDKFLV